MSSTMQLEFAQAMSDFKTMFPDMDRDVIEAVLRANQGAVDATIDQLLAMSTDNQNEKLRNEMDSTTSPQRSLINLNEDVGDGVGKVRSVKSCDAKHSNVGSQGAESVRLADMSNVSEPTGSGQDNTIVDGDATFMNLGATASSHHNTGASPKQRPTNKPSNQTDENTASVIYKPQRLSSRWTPPVLGPLPANFLRLQHGSGVFDTSRDFELPDEQFALMLQNEEFMNELRWNQEFMTALEREQYDKAKGEDDAAFKERLKNMGKLSRKKFLQIARVFTWQRNKKVNTAKQIDSLPLKEEPSDDEDHQQQHQHPHQKQQQNLQQQRQQQQ